MTKIIVKGVLFLFTLLVALQNVFALMTALGLLAMMRSGNPYWLREAYFTSPVLISFVPILTVAGCMIAVSALFNFSEKRKAALKNLIKYIIAFLLSAGATILLVAQVNKTGALALGQNISLFEALKTTFTLKVSNFAVFLVIVVGYVWVYKKESSLKENEPPKNCVANYVLAGVVLLSIFVSLGATLVGYSQSKILNPGLEEVKSEAPFVVFGFEKENGYRWTLAPKLKSEEGRVVGVVAPKNNLSSIIFVEQTKSSNENEQALQKLAMEKGAAFKEYSIADKTVKGFEQATETGGSRGSFIWRTDMGTDITITGIIDSNYNWPQVLTDLTSNFKPY